MKNNKGYYSWIHSLNEAAIKSQIRGFEMLNEAGKGPSRPVRNYLRNQVERPSSESSRSETAAAGIGKLMSDIGDPKEEIIRSAPDILSVGKMAIERPGSVAPSDASSDIGDVGPLSTAQLKQEIANASVAKMKAATASANAARAQGPVNLKPAGNANVVAMDGKDGEMADPDFNAPPRVHPEPWYKSADEANAIVKGLNAKKFAEENPMTGEEIAAREREEEEAEDYRREIRSMGENRKFVSSMIKKFLN